MARGGGPAGGAGRRQAFRLQLPLCCQVEAAGPSRLGRSCPICVCPAARVPDTVRPKRSPQDRGTRCPKQPGRTRLRHVLCCSEVAAMVASDVQAPAQPGSWALRADTRTGVGGASREGKRGSRVSQTAPAHSSHHPPLHTPKQACLILLPNPKTSPPPPHGPWWGCWAAPHPSLQGPLPTEPQVLH